MNRTWSYKLIRIASAALAAGILFYQLFSPGFVGLADNGDFPRLAGRYSLCPADGWDAQRFHHFVPVYVQRSSCYWDSKVPTSALVIAGAARRVNPGTSFGIRTLALFYSFIFLGLVAWWPPLLLFCDLANTAYFNSFYLDGFALVALMALMVAARHLLRSKTDRAIAAVAFAALLLVTSKTQHAALAVPVAVFLIVQVRWRAILPATALLGAAAGMSIVTPAEYKATNLWNSVFVSLVPHSPAALHELGLSPAYATFNNRNAYEFPSAAAAQYWEQRFSAEMSYTKLARYYLRHPVLALFRITTSARGLQHLRPDYLGNTQPGTAAYSQARRFDFFSTAKSYLFRHAPYAVLLFYAACGFLIPRPLAALLFAMAATEFLTSTFADSVLDYRHHALLQQLADLWLLCAGVRVLALRRLVGAFLARLHRGTHNYELVQGIEPEGAAQ